MILLNCSSQHIFPRFNSPSSFCPMGKHQSLYGNVQGYVQSDRLPHLSRAPYWSHTGRYTLHWASAKVPLPWMESPNLFQALAQISLFLEILPTILNAHTHRWATHAPSPTLFFFHHTLSLHVLPICWALLFRRNVNHIPSTVQNDSTCGRHSESMNNMIHIIWMTINPNTHVDSLCVLETFAVYQLCASVARYSNGGNVRWLPEGIRSLEDQKGNVRAVRCSQY